MCSNDKVIQSIKTLIEKNKHEKVNFQEKFKEYQFNSKCMNTEVENLNRQLEDLEKKEKEMLKQINKQIEDRKANPAQTGDAKGDIKNFEKQKNQEIRDITKANNARKTQLHQQLVSKEKIRFDLIQILTNTKNSIEDAAEN